ncbi:MAG: sigma-70 family RNA polymerase sigma factor [Candidatus Dormibacteraeota bacterium]|nr:sigma-70 family RNA polymerase sigma factor [Candidatus Dormibacteraeota bacterium]
MNASALLQEHAALDIEQAYRDHYAAVWRYVRARVATSDIAEDLVGDIFCHAVAASPRYRRLRESPLPWLYTIASNRVADHYRRRRETHSLDGIIELAGTEVGPAEVVEQRQDLELIWKCSRALPDSQRVALWLRYGEDRDLKEIATRMGRSVEAVKLLLHRGVRGVRKMLAAGDADRSEAPKPARAAAPVPAHFWTTRRLRPARVRAGARREGPSRPPESRTPVSLRGTVFV